MRSPSRPLRAFCSLKPLLLRPIRVLYVSTLPSHLLGHRLRTWPHGCERKAHSHELQGWRSRSPSWVWRHSSEDGRGGLYALLWLWYSWQVRILLFVHKHDQNVSLSLEGNFTSYSLLISFLRFFPSLKSELGLAQPFQTHILESQMPLRSISTRSSQLHTPTTAKSFWDICFAVRAFWRRRRNERSTLGSVNTSSCSSTLRAYKAGPLAAFLFFPASSFPHLLPSKPYIWKQSQLLSPISSQCSIASPSTPSVSFLACPSLPAPNLDSSAPFVWLNGWRYA